MDITKGVELLKTSIGKRIENARKDATPTTAELARRKAEEQEVGKKKPPIEGITQEELAARIGVKRDKLKHWESGEREIKASDLFSVASALDVSTDYLLGKTRHPTVNLDLRAVCDYLGFDGTEAISKYREHAHLPFVTEIIEILIEKLDYAKISELAQTLNELSQIEHEEFLALFHEPDKTNKSKDKEHEKGKSDQAGFELTKDGHVKLNRSLAGAFVWDQYTAAFKNCVEDTAEYVYNVEYSAKAEFWDESITYAEEAYYNEDSKA